MTHFRTRRFQPGDEIAINHCYVDVIQKRFPAVQRDQEVMRWLWYQSPGGAVESWVVEAENPDGSWKIIGHHGLCPIRFTLGRRDLLCAKTINTFLLPEFRSRFLYIRFEQQCLVESRSRYDAIYSFGPGIFRLRKPLGYEGADAPVMLEHGSRYFDLATRLFTRLVKKFPAASWIQFARNWSAFCARTMRQPAFEWIEYHAAEAIQSEFFAGFWEQARGEAGMSPRRDAADLAWHFWKRPGRCFQTLVHSWSGGAKAFCIVETSNPFLYQLADIFVTPMRPDLLEECLDALFAWCARRGALTITFRTTTRGQPPALMEVFSRRMGMHPLARFRKNWDFSYYLSPTGRVAGAAMPHWNVTDLLFPA